MFAIPTCTFMEDDKLQRGNLVGRLLSSFLQQTQAILRDCVCSSKSPKASFTSHGQCRPLLTSSSTWDRGCILLKAFLVVVRSLCNKWMGGSGGGAAFTIVRWWGCWN